MGDVVDAKQTFQGVRGAHLKKNLTAVKHKKLMDAHRDALIKDIGIALMVEIQRTALGDSMTDTFLDELQAYREYAAVCPHEFDDDHLMNNIVYGVSTQTDQFPVEAAFNHLTIEASKTRIPDTTQDIKYKHLLSQAKNTSYGLMLFREWSYLEEAEPVLKLTKLFASNGAAVATTTQIAREFIDGHITPSRAQISLSTEQAKANHKTRNREHAFEARCMQSNMHLVLNGR